MSTPKRWNNVPRKGETILDWEHATSIECRTCRTTKARGEFYESCLKRSDRNCKMCVVERTRKYRKDFPEKRYAYVRSWRQRNPDKAQSHYLRNSFGIDAAEYRRMLDEQNGVCAICHGHETQPDPNSGKIRRLAVDHDHTTGAIRGLLCSRCNIGLGWFREDPAYLKLAIAYLHTHAAEVSA